MGSYHENIAHIWAKEEKKGAHSVIPFKNMTLFIKKLHLLDKRTNQHVSAQTRLRRPADTLEARTECWGRGCVMSGTTQAGEIACRESIG